MSSTPTPDLPVSASVTETERPTPAATPSGLHSAAPLPVLPAFPLPVPARVALNDWTHRLEQETGELAQHIEAKQQESRAVRDRYAQDLAHLNAATSISAALIKQSDLALSTARLRLLVATLNPEDDAGRIRAYRTIENPPGDILQRPNRIGLQAGSVLAGLSVLALLLSDSLPLKVTLVILTVLCAALTVVVAQHEQRERAALIARLKAEAGAWHERSAPREKEVLRQRQQDLKQLQGTHDIDAAITRLQDAALALSEYLAVPTPSRFATVQLSSVGTPIQTTTKSQTAQQAATAAQRLTGLPYPLEFMPGQPQTTVFLGETPEIWEQMISMAPHLRGGMSEPLYRIDFTGQRYAERLEDLSLDPAPVTTEAQQIVDLLIEKLAVQVRRHRRANIIEPGLLVIFKVPLTLGNEGRTALYDLMQDGPATGLSVLVSLGETNLPKDRTWLGLGPQALVLYPYEALPSSSVSRDVTPGHWWTWKNVERGADTRNNAVLPVTLMQPDRAR